MKRLYLRILCLCGKHGRGKRITPMVRNEETGAIRPLGDTVQFQCRTCGATWTRKVRVKGQA